MFDDSELAENIFDSRMTECVRIWESGAYLMNHKSWQMPYKSVFLSQTTLNLTKLFNIHMQPRFVFSLPVRAKSGIEAGWFVYEKSDGNDYGTILLSNFPPPVSTLYQGNWQRERERERERNAGHQEGNVRNIFLKEKQN